MRTCFNRWTFVFALILLAAPAGAAPGTTTPVLRPDHLLVLSTTDVKGKTGPCGCHVPKGGLARRATYADSMRAMYGQLLLVDNGGFFPEEDSRRDAAAFLSDVMRAIGVDAVNVGDSDLRFGRAFLEARVKKSGLQVVSANLIDAKTRRPVFDPYVVKKVGGVSVGVFGLISERADLGPAKDSLAIGEPKAAAEDAVAQLKKKGANVIVLLSQLGKADGEDLVAAVDGIDAAVIGRKVPVMAQGRTVKNTTVCYGGDQGHYLCRTDLTLDATRHVKSGQAEAVELGPVVADSPGIATMVKSFEDALTQRGSEGKLKAVQAEEAPRTDSK